MFRILSFISTYRNLLVFLCLEALALWLIVRHNDYQRHQVGDAALAMGGRVNEITSKVNQYFNLGVDNQQLEDRIEELEAQKDSLQKRLDAYEGLMARDSMVNLSIDSMVSKEAFDLFPARVIRNTTNLKYNYITLDKGTSDGVKIGMGVVSPARYCG